MYRCSVAYFLVCITWLRSLLIPQEVISERMKGRRMVKIPQITGMVRDGDIEGDWVTIGTIVSKTHPRDTSKVCILNNQ